KVVRRLHGDVAGKVTAIGFLAKTYCRYIRFVRIEHGAANFGGPSHTADQKACCERVERAGMPSLASVQRPLGPLQGVVAGETLWLVQQQDTVEQLPASFRGPHSGNMFSKSRCADVLDQPPGRIVWNLLYPGAAKTRTRPGAGVQSRSSGSSGGGSASLPSLRLA